MSWKYHCLLLSTALHPVLPSPLWSNPPPLSFFCSFFWKIVQKFVLGRAAQYIFPFISSQKIKSNLFYFVQHQKFLSWISNYLLLEKYEHFLCKKVYNAFYLYFLSFLSKANQMITRMLFFLFIKKHKNTAFRIFSQLIALFIEVNKLC